MKTTIIKEGQKYNKLLIIKRCENTKFNKSTWLCKCDCGNTKIIRCDHILGGKIKSCGCLAKKNKKSKAYNRLHCLYKDMKARCYNKNSPSYKNYGARGITVCDEWKNDFMSFYNWAMTNGYDENKTRKEQTLDRINNNENYNPKNCRWVNFRKQANNTRKNVFLKYKNTTKTIAQWSRIFKMNYKKFYRFIHKKT